MRKPIVAALVTLCAVAAPGLSSAQTLGRWSYAYTNGIATATQTDDRGRTTATLTCAPPTGDIMITDYTFGREARRANRATVRIGAISVTVPATVQGRGREQSVVIRLPQSPPILAANQPREEIQVTVNNVTKTYLEGSAAKLHEVAYACWQGQ